MAIAKGLWFSSQSEFDSGKQHRYYIHKPYPFNSRDLISKSPYCLPHSFSFDVSLENLVLDQLVIPYLMVFFFLVTCLLDIVLIV